MNTHMQLSFVVPDPAVQVLREATLVEPPAERLRQYGAGALALDELVQLILGVNDLLLAARIVTQYPSVDELANASQLEVECIEGMTSARAGRLLAAAELARRTPVVVKEPIVRSPADLAHYLEPKMSGLDQEQFVVVLMDTKMRIKGMRVLYQGNVYSTTIRLAEVFRDAIRTNMPHIAIAHNHPSGSCDASPEDVSISREIVELGKTLDIKVVDHIIIGGRGVYCSLKERGLGGL